MRLTKAIGLGEATFVVLALIFFQGAFGSLLLLQNGALTDDARASLRVVNLPFYALTFLLLAPYVRVTPMIRGAKANWHLAVLIALACLSIMWSIAPDISLRRCIALLCTALFAIYICARYELRSMLRLLAIACGAVILLSLAFIVVLPAIGLSPIDHTWRGVFPNKNTFGRNLLLAAIVFAYVEARPGWPEVLRKTGIATAVIVLWLCGSRGPLLVFVLVVPVMLLLWTRRFRLETRALLGVSLLLLTFIGAAGIWLYSQEVFDVLARDPTLTGRTELWSLVGAAVAERPWVGYGYGAFWEATTGLSTAIWESIGWDAPNAHNGYMDLWLSVGIVGPLLLVISVGLNLKNAATWLRSGSGSDARWCVVFLVTLMISNLNESDFLEQNSVLMILYVTATIYAQRATRRRVPAPALVSSKGPLRLHPSASRG